VVDQGIGMSPAFIRDKLFKPFVSSKEGGFGIGAFEAQQLAHAMQGRIEVTSREGKGTCFRVILKAAHPADLGQPSDNWGRAA
jgi:signal transduction histidine kinase